MNEKVSIYTLDSKGRGIGRLKDKPIFLFNALQDEEVMVTSIHERSKYITGEVSKVLKKSSKRVEPICPYFGQCGGCDLMHMSYEDQLTFKEKKVRDTITRVLKEDILVRPIIHSSCYHYRNKAIFKVSKKIGFYGKESHEIVPIEACYLVHPKMNELLKIISTSIFLEGIDEIMIRVGENTNESMVLFSITGEIDEEQMKEVLKNKVSTVILKKNQEKVLFGNGFIHEKLGKFMFKISPESFFQVNTKGAELLYSVVSTYIEKGSSILDLYCGTGSIGIFVSDKVNRLLGVEINQQAIENALENKILNHLEHAEFICLNTSLFDRSLNDFDQVIIDPPRSGLDKKTIQYLLKEEVPKMVYVSCDLMTLTRDLGILKEKYDIQEITPVDLFSNTYHVENVVLLVKKA